MCCACGVMMCACAVICVHQLYISLNDDDDVILEL